ncbi:efflux RND transporter permease subunit [Parasulfuritortus cantonensis]|uniref:Efflux RND transporter permease subunit n=1 Tax=Parasulfuritortus cantonensis TaxID=2528202 RepID=A0A4R1BCI5_9PROT|nr:efflux RND transporter permease subunit [Parasulfuritortus cantonensis]TCJ14760.1 efflux RND transporter permease subunit [Parasulfuritortus cantonensis]
MIAKLIGWSIQNRFLVLLATLIATVAGTVAVVNMPVDALPDLSDVQVIIRTPFPGQAPKVVEDQVTYPLATTMMSVPGAKVVRGYSMFGDSYVYILFEDGTDLYWARSRVLEYLNTAAGKLPSTAKPSIGPDATGVGWIYEYALVDKTGRHDLGQLRSLQDWFLKYELQAIPNVSEVATIGGMVKQYQIVVDPERMRALGVPLAQLVTAVKRANQEAGGSVLEMSEAEYMVRATGYLQSVADIEAIPVGLGQGGTPVLLRDIARVQVGPQMRRGIAELDGEGEVVGGVIVMRYGANAMRTIEAVKAKLAELKKSLPEGVEIVPTYDRSGLIARSVATLTHRLAEEFVVVALVCVAFLFHLRSSFVAIVSLPLGILIAFMVMRHQGINANIMSLGGIAIAIGAMVDAAVVMIENAHKHLEAWRHAYPAAEPSGADYFELARAAAVEVGPALFFSLLIITVSFLPVFTLEAQEGRLFAPLAYTKTYAMAAAAGLSVTLIPILMGYFIRGRIKDEHSNPLSRGLIALYRPLIQFALKYPKGGLVAGFLALAATLYPVSRLGSEFIPPLDEGDLLSMPTTLPGLSPGKAAQLLQLSDRMIKTVPEVKSVFGKIGRADTATDPAPLTMIETTIQLKDPSEWRPGQTLDGIVRELDRNVQIPGLANLWIQPIRTRLDMLSTGIKSPVGVKIAGPDLNVIERIGADIEAALKAMPETASAFSERVAAGRYLNVEIDREAAARYGLNIADIQELISVAVGGATVTETVEGLERYPVQIRFPREARDSVEAIKELPIVTRMGATVPLAAVARIEIADGPPMLKSENARPNGWIFVDIKGGDLGGYVAKAKQVVADKVRLPPGYSIAWSGQYEFLERAVKRLKLVVPLTLVAIFVLLYLTFRNLWQPVLIMATLPFALIGGYWLLYLLGFNMSVAVAVGFIALAGVAAEFGVVMLIYLDQAVATRRAEGRYNTRADLMAAIMDGAVLRVRPKAMTVAVILAGLFPIMVGGGTGSEVMQRIAAPMLGGMITAPLLSMFVIPVAYLLWRRRALPAG